MCGLGVRAVPERSASNVCPELGCRGGAAASGNGLVTGAVIFAVSYWVDQLARLGALTDPPAATLNINPTRTRLRSNLDHELWQGYFGGPLGWGGLRVVAHEAGRCRVPEGPLQECRATGEWQQHGEGRSGGGRGLESRPSVGVAGGWGDGCRSRPRSQAPAKAVSGTAPLSGVMPPASTCHWS
jgi:hypothetical protein